MRMSSNKALSVDGGIPRVSRIGRAQPATTEAQRWAAMNSRRLISTIHRMAFVLGIITLMGTGCIAKKGSANSDKQKLQGTWQLVYQQKDGKKLPDERAAKMFHGRVVFVGDKLHYSVELPGFDFEFAYKLHPERQPKAIDLQFTHTGDRKDVGERAFGIYSLEGDNLKICHSDVTRPTDFNAEQGSSNVLIVLKRRLERQ